MSEFMQMMKDAVRSNSSEEVMWKVTEVVDEILCGMKETHPAEYNKYMRKISEAINGCHYNETIAIDDVDAMHHTNDNGEVMSGCYWTPEQIEEAYSGKKFPEGTTKWDMFVAANAMWHDLSSFMDEANILETAYRIFFADEDSDTNGKIWKYMNIHK